MRIPGLRRDRGDDQSFEQLPSQIICPVCGLRNDSMARFCRNCGLPLGAPRDPVRGTTTGRADLPSEHGAGIAAVVGLLVAIVVLAAAGYLILKSNSGPGTALLPTPTARATAAPGATPGPAGTPGPLPSRLPVRSLSPGESTPADTPAPSDAVPTGSAAPTATPLVADTNFVCDTAASFLDPSKSQWHVSAARWGGRDKWDELTLVLAKDAGKGKTTVTVEAMDSRTAAQVSGLDPAPGSRVLLITFEGDTISKNAIVADIAQYGLRQLDYLNVDDANGTTYAVVGVNKDTCYRMSVPSWKKGDGLATGDTVSLLLDVKYR